MCDVCKADICFLDIRIWEFLLLSKTVCSWGDSKEAGKPHFNEAAHWKDHAVLFEFCESVMIEKSNVEIRQYFHGRNKSIVMIFSRSTIWCCNRWKAMDHSSLLAVPIWHVDIWTNQFLQKYRFLPSSWHSVIRRWRVDLENIWRFYFFKSSILLQAAFMNSIEEGSFQMLKTKCKNFVITGCRRGFHWILSKHRFRIWNFSHHSRWRFS